MYQFSETRQAGLYPLGLLVRPGAALGLAAFLFAGMPAASEARDKAKAEEAAAKSEQVSPEDSSGQKGALTMIISLQEQTIDVWRGDEKIDSSRVSSGRRGYPTPGGVFSILQKNKWHRSNLYSGAPMPYMQRLTWSGVALHAGVLPGYPASHGCIRVTTSFARKIWKMTDIGHHVIVSYAEAAEPKEIEHSFLFQPSEAAKVTEIEPDADAVDDVKQLEGANSPVVKAAVKPDESDEGVVPAESTEPLRILITQRTGAEKLREAQQMLYDMGFTESEPDGLMGPETVKAIKWFQAHKGMEEDGEFDDEVMKRLYQAARLGEPPNGHIYVRQDMKQLFDAGVTIEDPEKPLGTHLFVASLYEEEVEKVDWITITPDKLDDAPASAADVLDRIEMPKEVRQRIAGLMTPGTSLLVSDGGISIETGPKGTDFVALTPRPDHAKVAAQPKSQAEPRRRRTRARTRVRRPPSYAYRRHHYERRSRRPSRGIFRGPLHWYW